MKKIRSVGSKATMKFVKDKHMEGGYLILNVY